MANNGIVPVKLSLTKGDFYTLWAPSWREHGAEWQAFLGAGDDLFVFHSPAELLVFLESDEKHDLQSHPKWGAFSARDALRAVPAEKEEFDLVGVPAFLADKPSSSNVKAVARCFRIARSLGDVAASTPIQVFFSSHSILGNAERGLEHFTGPAGMSEWTAIGRVVLVNWDSVIDELDDLVTVKEVDEDKIKDTEQRIEETKKINEEKQKAEEQKRKEEAEQVDPYDNTVWGIAGIDPIKALVRWLVEHDDHDLAKVSTWEDIMTVANAGELGVTVHQDNVYSFNGITRDIEKGPEQVDSNQLLRAYELLADAADWAGDDSLNSFFLANPRMQDYISYLTGYTNNAGYTPTPPFNEHAEAWQQLEDMLTKRFSKF